MNREESRSISKIIYGLYAGMNEGKKIIRRGDPHSMHASTIGKYRSDLSEANVDAWIKRGKGQENVSIIFLF